MSDYPDNLDESGERPRGRSPFRLLPGGQDLPTSEPDSVPHSVEAEEHVIACCLLEPDGAIVARCLREKIRPDTFYFPATRLLFEILVQMHTAKKVIMLEVLAEELKTRRQLEAVGGFPYLMQVTSKIPTTAHAGYFIEKIREKWILRKLDLIGRELVEKTRQYTGGLDDHASRFALKLQRIADFVTRMNRPSPAVEAKEAREQLVAILDGKVDHTRRLSLGTPYTDAVLRPLDVRNEDWFAVLCAPPSGGKSTAAGQVVQVNCEAGKRGAVFLLETGKRRWQWARAANKAKVNLGLALDHPKQLFPEDRERLLAADAEVAAWMGQTLWVYDDVYNIEDIERTIRELDRTLREKDQQRADRGEIKPEEVHGLDFAVIDYLQLVKTREKIFKREEYVAHISRSCKIMFKSVNISGIVLSQLNRKSRDEERRPRLSDLRESGAIEQDADVVLALYTPATDRSGAPQDGERTIKETELILLKRRNGPANIAVDLLCYSSQGRYADDVHKGELRPGMPKPADGYGEEEPI